MRPIVVLGLFSAVLSACASPPASPTRAPSVPTSRQQPQTSASLQVMVETMVVEIPPRRLGMLGARTFAQIAADSNVRVLATPHVLLVDHEEARFELAGSDAAISASETVGDWSWRLKADVLEGDQIQLSIDLKTSSPSRGVATSIVVAPEQTMIMPTTLTGIGDGTVVMLMRAEVVRGRDDLRRIFERKMRERKELLEGREG